jgi:hypothetical protein
MTSPSLNGRVISINSFADPRVQLLDGYQMEHITPPGVHAFYEVFGMRNVVSYNDRVFPNEVADELYVREISGSYQFCAQYNVEVYFGEGSARTVYVWVVFDPISVGFGASRWWDFLVGRYPIKDLAKLTDASVGISLPTESVVVWDFKKQGEPQYIARNGRGFASVANFDQPNFVVTNAMLKALATRMYAPEEGAVKDGSDLLHRFVLRADIGTSDKLTIRYDGATMPSSQSDDVMIDVGDADACSKMLERNARFVNWDFATVHFLRAIELTRSSFVAAEYKKFDDWRTSKASDAKK